MSKQANNSEVVVPASQPVTTVRPLSQKAACGMMPPAAFFYGGAPFVFCSPEIS
ncbi:hypothetical protein GN316_15915 [Xylophilus sp. Kf1]|nr:hypothetical protein [Xylophilus sp. Kf1]